MARDIRGFEGFKRKLPLSSHPVPKHTEREQAPRRSLSLSFLFFPTGVEHHSGPANPTPSFECNRIREL